MFSYLQSTLLRCLHRWPRNIFCLLPGSTMKGKDKKGINERKAINKIKSLLTRKKIKNLVHRIFLLKFSAICRTCPNAWLLAVQRSASVPKLYMASSTWQSKNWQLFEGSILKKLSFRKEKFLHQGQNQLIFCEIFVVLYFPK